MESGSTSKVITRAPGSTTLSRRSACVLFPQRVPDLDGDLPLAHPHPRLHRAAQQPLRGELQPRRQPAGEQAPDVGPRPAHCTQLRHVLAAGGVHHRRQRHRGDGQLRGGRQDAQHQPPGRRPVQALHVHGEGAHPGHLRGALQRPVGGQLQPLRQGALRGVQGPGGRARRAQRHQPVEEGALHPGVGEGRRHHPQRGLRDRGGLRRREGVVVLVQLGDRVLRVHPTADVVGAGRQLRRELDELRPLVLRANGQGDGAGVL